MNPFKTIGSRLWHWWNGREHENPPHCVKRLWDAPPTPMAIGLAELLKYGEIQSMFANEFGGEYRGQTLDDVNRQPLSSTTIEVEITDVKPRPATREGALSGFRDVCMERQRPAEYAILLPSASREPK